MRRRLSVRASIATAFAAGALLFAAGCGSNSPPPTGEIIETIPWTESEAHAYVLVNRDQEEQARGVISIVEDGDGWVISQEFDDGSGNADRSQVAVSDRLLPIAGRRTIVGAEDDRREELTTSYGELSDGSHGVLIRQQTYRPRDDDEASSTRCNPNKLTEFAYDNDTSLMLWRTIKFEEGFEITYTASIAGRRTDRALTLRVRRQERVTTPAGEFDAWLVGIAGEGETQNAWFSTDPSHKLLVYDNDREIFLYTGEADVPEIDDPPAQDPSLCEPDDEE